MKSLKPLLFAVAVSISMSAMIVVPAWQEENRVSLVKLAPSFAADIQPILERRCVRCHGPARSEAGLRLDSYAAITQGGQRDDLIVPGEPDYSYLVTVIEHRTIKRMPDGEMKLSATEIKNIRNWIARGAPNN